MTIADATLGAACGRAWSQPQWAARAAIVTARGALSYADLHRRVGQVAGGLRAAGVEFTQEPVERYGSIDAGFRDPAGNGWKMIQAPRAAA